jgi:hypothetical protein
MMKAERELINLMKTVITIIKKHIGSLNNVKLLIKENVFDYILNNLILIKELNLDKFLLELLLER